MTTSRIEATLASIGPDAQLHYENYQVVSAVQALLGAITPNMVAISLACIGEEVHLYFYLEHESLDDRDEIEDVAGELSALQTTNVPIHTYVCVIGFSGDCTDVAGRSIYRRHVQHAAG